MTFLRNANAVAVVACVTLIACGEGITDGTKVRTNDSTYVLIGAAGGGLPAVYVRGTCQKFGNGDGPSYPDTILIKSGLLILRRDSMYHMEYQWQGQTDACNVLGATRTQNYDDAYYWRNDLNPPNIYLKIPPDLFVPPSLMNGYKANETQIRFPGGMDLIFDRK